MRAGPWMITAVFDGPRLRMGRRLLAVPARQTYEDCLSTEDIDWAANSDPAELDDYSLPMHDR